MLFAKEIQIVWTKTDREKLIYRMVEGTIRPILTYGMTAIKTTKKEEGEMQKVTSKIYRQIENAGVKNNKKTKPEKKKSKEP